MLLHALLRGWLSVLARRKAYIIVSDIVERFSLEESDFENSYAKQLLAKGVLTPTEAEVFAGNYHDSTDGPPSGPTSEGSPGNGNGVNSSATADTNA
jgi:hypothetical protein